MKELTDRLAAIGAPIAEEQALAHEERKIQERGHSKSDEQKRDSVLVGDSTGKPKLKPWYKPVCYNYRQRGHFQRDFPNTRKGPHKAETAAEKAPMPSQLGRIALTVADGW